MRNMLLLVALAAVLASCATPMKTVAYTSYTARPVIEIVSVERTIRKDNRVDSRYSMECSGSTVSANNENELISIGPRTFTDQYVSITTYLNQKSLYLSITNKSGGTVSLDWDKAAFVDIDGTSGRLVPSDIRYVDVAKSIPPSVIVSNGTLSKSAVPASNVYYSDGYVWGMYIPSAAGWQVRDIYRTSTSENAESLKEYNTSFQYKALLPLEINEYLHEYLITFRIVKTEIIPKSETKRVPADQ